MGLRPLRPKKLRPINFHHDKFAVSTSTGNSHLSMISTSHLPRSLFWFLIQYYQESLQFCLLFLLCKQWGYTPESVVCHQRWNFADWIDVKLQSRGYILCCFLPQVKNYQLLMIVQRPWTEELNGAGQHPMMGQMIWVGQHPNGAGNIRWSGLVNVHGLMCWLGWSSSYDGTDDLDWSTSLDWEAERGWSTSNDRTDDLGLSMSNDEADKRAWLTIFGVLELLVVGFNFSFDVLKLLFVYLNLSFGDFRWC